MSDFETAPDLATLASNPAVKARFRGFLPVVVDVETAGFDAGTHALLEVAAVVVLPNAEGQWQPVQRFHAHLKPEAGLVLDPAALKFNGINPNHPLRLAVSEADALKTIFAALKKVQKDTGCKRCILVGHNANFDLAHLNAAIDRQNLKNQSPFHPFSVFDTATLAGLAYGQTVLARACEAAGLAFNQSEAHSALYDAHITAELFCGIVNRWEMAYPFAESASDDVTSD